MTRQLAIPKRVSDLVAELRERHLLLPIVGLIVAIAAVPFVLGGGSAETVPPSTPPAGAVAEDDSELQPAVLIEQDGIRDYRRRLEALRKKNPFDQQFDVDPESDTVAVTGGSGALGDPSVTVDDGASATASSSSSAFPSTSASGSTGPAPASTPSTAPVSPSGVSGSGTSKPVEPQKPIVRYYAGRIDVKVGTAGAQQVLENVRYLDFLPSAKEPVVTFVGLVGSGKAAVFAVSREVTETDGEGSCAPKRPAPCQFVRLRVDQEQAFTYGDAGERVRMKLLDARIVRVPELGDKPGG